jgi:quinone-modifying oxidoreductase subunit QmoC
MNVQPDLDFIRDMKSAGGDTLKKCFQCATCSVVCPLSSDDKPFPRREMIMAQWGLKEKLIGDPNVMLCHQCGDCTAYCPRGAKPGDVLGAIRAYTYKYFGWPSGLANLASSGKNLPVLIGIPAVIIFVLWWISGGMSIPNVEDFARHGYGHFFGHWNFHWLSKNVFYIDLFILPTAALSLYATYKGVAGLWQKMSENAGVGDAPYRPSISQFIKEFLAPAINEIIQHNRFRQCTANADRVRGHLPLLLSFIGLFIVTVYSAVTQDVLSLLPGVNLHGPMSMWNPVKIMANVAAIALIVGVGILWGNRSKMELDGKTTKTFYDWFLIWEIMAVGVTGLAAELFRLIGVASIGYVIYYLHLISVMMLFLYMPYTKFAHLAYRTFAMAFERYRESAYVKNPLNN